MQDFIETVLLALMALPLIPIFVLAMAVVFHHGMPFAERGAQAIMRLL